MRVNTGGELLPLLLLVVVDGLSHRSLASFSSFHHPTLLLTPFALHEQVSYAFKRNARVSLR